MTTPLLDMPDEVRKGAELNVDKLAEFLGGTLGLTGEIQVEQFRRGHSNLTYCIAINDRELVLRRAPPGVKIKSAHDMGREYRILSALADAGQPVPRPLALCESESVLGSSFYVMERLHGVILRNTAHARKLGIDEATMHRLAEALVDNLAALHALDYQAAGLGDLGKPDGYVGRQVSGWTDRYRKAKTDDIPEMESVAGWLAENQPGETGASLIHNDYKYDNVVLAPDDLTHITGVLDWEMATIGDPLMDLGTTLAYWIDPDDPEDLRSLELGALMLPGNLTRAEVVQRYRGATGRSVEDAVFYYAYGLFKVCVIGQQLYARFQRGLSQDERFAQIIQAVRICSRHAARAIEKNRLDRLG